MGKARTRVTSAALLVVAALGGCGERGQAPAGEVRRPQMAEVHTDVEGLSRWLTLPPGARAARWRVRPRAVGSTDVPGPTDTVLVAFVQIDPAKWAEVERALAPGGGGTLEIEEGDATAVLPAVAALPRRNGKRLVSGPSHAAQALARSPYLTEWAIRWQDGLVFVLYSR